MYAYIVRRIEGTAAYRRMSDVPFAPIFGASPCATVRPWGTRGHLYRGDLTITKKPRPGDRGLVGLTPGAVSGVHIPYTADTVRCPSFLQYLIITKYYGETPHQIADGIT